MEVEVEPVDQDDLDREENVREWQPIETAPKDGTLVDLWVDGERYTDCAWEGLDGDSEQGKWFVTYKEAGPGWLTEAPTYWLPLPKPPGSLAPEWH